MIGQIGYLGQVSPRKGALCALLYTLGAILGAAVLGFALGSVGHGVRWLFNLSYQPHTPGVLLSLACLALFGGLQDLKFTRVRLPMPTKQLPRYWMHVLGPFNTSFLWGFNVGLARYTRVDYHVYYVLVLWILLAGNPLLGALALAVYGLTNGVLLVLEVTAIGAGIANINAGLLGAQRVDYFYRFGGAALLGCGVFLLVQSGLIRWIAG